MLMGNSTGDRKAQMSIGWFRQVDFCYRGRFQSTNDLQNTLDQKKDTTDNRDRPA